MGKNRLNAIHCYVLSTRLGKVLELFYEDDVPFNLVVKRGVNEISGQKWRRVRIEMADLDFSSWEALAACEWIKAASQLDVIFTNQGQINRDIYCLA